MLLRHAKSDWSSPGMADPDRPLNERGESAAHLMGAYLVRHGLVPDRILCSPARRTRETCAAITGEWTKEATIDYADSLYAASPETILSAIRAAPTRARNLMVIGHNPGLQALAEQLIAAGDVGARERLREKFPTCALAVIDFATDSWDKIHAQGGRLDRFITPRSIAAATS